MGEERLAALARRDWVTFLNLVGGPGREEEVQTGDYPGLGSAPLRLLHKSGARVAAVYPRNLPTFAAAPLAGLGLGSAAPGDDSARAA